MFSGYGDSSSNAVLPSLKTAQSALKDVLATLKQVESTTANIAKNIQAASAAMGGMAGGMAGGGGTGISGGSMGIGSSGGNLMPHMPPANSGGAGSGGGSTATAIAGMAARGIYGTVPGVNGNTVDMDVTLRNLGLTNGMSGNTGYNRGKQLMQMSRASFGAIDTSDMMGAYQTGMSAGFTGNQMTAAMPSMSQWAIGSGMSLTSTMGMANTMQTPQNMFYNRMLGLNSGDPKNPASIPDFVNSLYARTFRGKQVSAAEVAKSFRYNLQPGLSQMGYSDEQIQSIESGMEQISAKDKWLTKGGKNGLNDTAVAGTRARAHTDIVSNAESFQGTIHGMDAANASATLMGHAVDLVNRYLGSLAGTLKGFQQSLGNNPETGRPDAGGVGLGTALNIGKAVATGGGPSDSNPPPFKTDPGTNFSGGGGGSTINAILGMAQGYGSSKMRVTSAFRPGGGSYHAKGEAVDFAPPSPEVDSPALLGINQYFATHYGNALAELIYAGPGGTLIKNGKRVDNAFYGAGTMAEHHNHVHVAMDPAGAAKIGSRAGGDPSGASPNSMNSSGGGLGNALSTAAASAMSTAGRLMGSVLDPAVSMAASILGLGGGGGGHASSGGGSTPGLGAPSSTSAAANKALGQQMAAAYGWTGSEWDALNAVAMRESGWRVDATNGSSGAYGIPQSLPGNKMASKGADWKTNPRTQIAWMLDYIKGRYTDPLGAINHEQKVGWYRDGKYKLPADELAVVHQGEMILPEQIAEAVRSHMNGSNGATPTKGGVTVYMTNHFANADAASAMTVVRQIEQHLENRNHLTSVGSS